MLKRAIPMCLAIAGCDPAPSAPPQTQLRPSIASYLSCVPDGVTVMAAHRGTSQRRGLAENARGSLEALIEAGVQVAEIDVARTRDGVHILYHDGVWDEGSTGRGPIVATHFADSQMLLLRDDRDRITDQRPPRLEDILTLAKDRIYLEIDFKTSANYEQVIEIIRETDMSDQVVLIAYSAAAARKLARLAPKMMISIPAKDARKRSNAKRLVWMGKSATAAQIAARTQPAAIRVTRATSNAALRAATLAVTDTALDGDPVRGLTAAKARRMEACLAKG